jgi:hypothetical protein
MSVKVLRHGDIRDIKNPVTGKTTRMQNIVFVEEGRTGAVKGMSESTDILNEIAGEQTGLNLLRIHTHPVLVDAVKHYPVGRIIEGVFINRSMWSEAQIRQQAGAIPRMVDGEPTFFTTALSKTPKEDVDMRKTTDQVLKIQGAGAYNNARVQVAQVDLVEAAETAGYGNDSGLQEQRNQQAQAQPAGEVLAGAGPGNQPGNQGLDTPNI